MTAEGGVISSYTGEEDEAEFTIDVPHDITVMLGMPIGKPVPPQTIMSLCDTIQQAACMGLQLSYTVHVCGVINVTRDNVLDQFLRSDCQKLLMADSDMVWSFASVIRMIALSTKFDVVAAAYPSRSDGTFMLAAGGDGLDTPPGPYGLRKIGGTGLGFTIIDRKVAESLAEKAPRVIDQGVEMAAIFRVDADEHGNRRTEDIAFFADIRALGFDVWCDPSIELGHVGEKVWSGRLADVLPGKAA